MVYTVNRIEAIARVLEHHGDLVAPELAQLGLGKQVEIAYPPITACE